MKRFDEEEFDKYMKRKNAIKLFNSETYYRSAFSNLKAAFGDLVRFQGDYVDALEESGYSSEQIKNLKEYISIGDIIKMDKILRKWDEKFSYDIISINEADEGDAN